MGAEPHLAEGVFPLFIRGCRHLQFLRKNGGIGYSLVGLALAMDFSAYLNEVL